MMMMTTTTHQGAAMPSPSRRRGCDAGRRHHAARARTRWSAEKGRDAFCTEAWGPSMTTTTTTRGGGCARAIGVEREIAKLMPETLLVHAECGEGAFGRGLFVTGTGATLARLPLARAMCVPAAVGGEIPESDEKDIRDIYLQGWVENFSARVPGCVLDFMMRAPFAKDVRLTAGVAWATANVDAWREYGEDVVPSEFDSMYLANEEELDALQDGQIRVMAERSRAGYEATWAAAMAAHPDVARELSSIDARKIEWCRSWVHTRAISGKIGDTECAFLAPTIDLANHRVESTAKYGVSEDGASFELTWNEQAAEGPTPVKGTEVFISYGDRMNNALLMLHYGFIDDNNRNERLPMEFIAPGARRVSGDRVLEAMRALEAQGDAKAAWAASNMLMMAARGPPPGTDAPAPPPTDSSVIQAMRDAVDAYARQSGQSATTVDDDQALLSSSASDSLSPRMSLAVRYRLAQKQNAAAFLRFLDILQ